MGSSQCAKRGPMSRAGFIAMPAGGKHTRLSGAGERHAEARHRQVHHAPSRLEILSSWGARTGHDTHAPLKCLGRFQFAAAHLGVDAPVGPPMPRTSRKTRKPTKAASNGRHSTCSSSDSSALCETRRSREYYGGRERILMAAALPAGQSGETSARFPLRQVIERDVWNAVSASSQITPAGCA